MWPFSKPELSKPASAIVKAMNDDPGRFNVKEEAVSDFFSCAIAEDTKTGLTIEISSFHTGRAYGLGRCGWLTGHDAKAVRAAMLDVLKISIDKEKEEKARQSVADMAEFESVYCGGAK